MTYPIMIFSRYDSGCSVTSAVLQASSLPLKDIAAYAVCTESGAQKTCEVTDEVAREDPDSLIFPDEHEPARLICAEGQVDCVVAAEEIAPEDIEALFPEAEDLRIFTAQSDADPVGSWQVTFDDTVVTCGLYVTEAPGDTLPFIIERLDDGTMAWKFRNSSGPFLKLGWGTYGFMDLMAAFTWRDVDYIAMISEDSFTGTLVGNSVNPDCTRDWNFDGVRSE